jgi:DNA repair protein NreA
MKIKRVKYKDLEQVPLMKTNKVFKKDFFGSSPAPFIGRYGYPNVNIGFLSPQFSGDTSYYHSPRLWSKSDFAIGQVANFRSGLVNSRAKASIKKAFDSKNKLLNICQEVGMAKRAVELEANLNKVPNLQIKSEKEVIPFGPGAGVKFARITENTKVDSRVERVVSDTDLKSVKALISLYKKGFEEASLSKILSVGNLGIGKNRKLVPTRWSITATDSTIGNSLVKEVKDLSVGDFEAYFGGGWGNYYLILMFPEIYSYELFETYLNSSVKLGADMNPWSKDGLMYSTDYEPYLGRKTYAEETAGGFYTVRLALLEHMKKIKRQGSVLALRFITPEYNVPLGVWVTREASRKSLAAKPIRFASKELMLKYAELFVKKKFGFDVNLLTRESLLLKNMNEQAKLTQFV